MDPSLHLDRVILMSPKARNPLGVSARRSPVCDFNRAQPLNKARQFARDLPIDRESG